MEIETTIQKLNGSIYIRVPANMVDYFNLSNTPEIVLKKAKIKDISKNKVQITFPLW